MTRTLSIISIVLLSLVALGVFIGRGARLWRASVRREFVDYLREHAPDVQVIEERDREISVRTEAGGDGLLSLYNLFAEVSKLGPADRAGREAAFNRFVAMLHESGSAATLTESDRDRIRPRLVTEPRLTQLRSQLKEDTIPAVPSGVSGLSVVFVLDSPGSVAYMTARHLSDLHLSEVDALALAKTNLARAFDSAAVRSALSDGSLNVIKTNDAFDAARILLVPQFLEPGESIAALIPDRDTLVLTVVPVDGDWSRLRKLAGAAAGERLWREPLIVTREGIAPVK